MPISYYQMSVSLVRAMEKCPEVKFQKTKRLVTSRNLLLMPVLAQLIGLADHLNEWDWAKTDQKRGAYIDLDAILESLSRHDENNQLPALVNFLESAFDTTNMALLTKQDMQLVSGQLALIGAALPKQKPQKSKK